MLAFGRFCLCNIYALISPLTFSFIVTNAFRPHVQVGGLWDWWANESIWEHITNACWERCTAGRMWHSEQWLTLYTHMHTDAYTHTLSWGGGVFVDWGHNLACGLEMISDGRSLIGRSLASPPPTSVLSQLLWGDSGGGL